MNRGVVGFEFDRLRAQRGRLLPTAVVVRHPRQRGQAVSVARIVFGDSLQMRDGFVAPLQARVHRAQFAVSLRVVGFDLQDPLEQLDRLGR